MIYLVKRPEFSEAIKWGNSVLFGNYGANEGPLTNTVVLRTLGKLQDRDRFNPGLSISLNLQGN